MTITFGLDSFLVTLANRFVSLVRNNIASQNLPTVISDALSISTVRDMPNGGKEIDVIIDLVKAPMARAFEYGSGIHGEGGQTYPIYPKNVPVLAFEWSPRYVPGKSEKFAGISKTSGKFLFHYVDHPGVVAKPYLQPALNELEKDNIMQDMAKQVLVTLILGNVENARSTHKYYYSEVRVKVHSV